MRLQKALARAGVASRRAAEELIVAGRVTVNGVVTDQLGVRVDPERDDIRLDGRRVAAEAPVVFKLHKPRGVVSSVSDPQGRPTVRALLTDVRERVYPVGRLDADTTGLILLTNDGELANRIMHPRYEVSKVYQATVVGAVSAGALRALATGVRLDDGLTAPAQVRRLEGGAEGTTRLELRLHEGRNRQVRRMCEAVGHPVIALHRTRVGPIGLGPLGAGQYAPLTREERLRLYRLVGLSTSP